MSNYMELKSKVINLFNYKDVDISSFVVQYEPDQQQVEKDIMFLRKKNTELVEVEEVADDDIVTLSCNSENSKFNKENIVVNVGKGLFHKEIEKNLVGMKKTEQKEVIINEDVVCIRVNKISRRHVLELTDETVIKWNIEGVNGVTELKKWVINNQFENYLEEEESVVLASGLIYREVLAKSTFSLDEDEFRKTGYDAMKKTRDVITAQGLSFDALTKEQVEETLGVSSIEEYTDLLKDIYESNLKIAVIGNKIMKQLLNPITCEDYEKEVQNHAQLKGIDAEEEKEVYTTEEFMLEKYSDYYIDMILEYTLNYLKEEMLVKQQV